MHYTGWHCSRSLFVQRVALATSCAAPWLATGAFSRLAIAEHEIDEDLYAPRRVRLTPKRGGKSQDLTPMRD
jgi:hypothetical protein